MQFDRIPVSKLKRARIRYYESDKHGCEIPDVEAYTFFLKVNNTYINLVHPFEESNVYGRVPYPNSTKDGEDFGSKLVLLNGKEEDGICYVLDNDLELFDNRDYVSLEEVERIMISDFRYYYYDRWDLAFGDRKDCTSLLERLRVLKLDADKRERFLKYLDSKKNQKELKKVEN